MRQVVIAGVGEAMSPVPAELAEAQAPLDLMQRASLAALEEAGGDAVRSRLDTIAVVRTFSDSAELLRSPFGDPQNLPRALAHRLGVAPARAVYSAAGGDVPQQLVSEFSARIAAGDCEVVLLAGGEALANQKALRRASVSADWSDPTDGPVEDRGSEALALLDDYQLYSGLVSIPAIYTLFENARRARLGEDRDTYADRCARVFETFARVAEDHPMAMFREPLDADRIRTVTPDNPAVTDAYPRALCAKDGVNQGAAIVLMSEAFADEIGLTQEQRVYPVTGSHGVERTLAHREDLSGSIASEAAYAAALDAAGLTPDQLGCLDLYSSFPIAVFAACEAMGIATDDPRGLTVTGGLPYFGGPGNNYSMHGIAGIVRRLRCANDGYGLVGASGGFLSKHAVGIYSATPPADGWRPADNGTVRARVARQHSPPQAGAEANDGHIETYCVEFDRRGPVRGFAVGRTAQGHRFIAATRTGDNATVAALLASDPLGRQVVLSADGRRHTFHFAAS